MTMKLISTVTVAAATSTIIFSAIPQTGTDLLVLASLRVDSGGNQSSIYVNDTSNDQYLRVTTGSGSTTSSFQANLASDFLYTNINSDAAAAFSNTSVYFANYTNTTNTKYYSVENVREAITLANNTLQLDSRLKNSTSPVTYLQFYNLQNFAVGSTISLYTISNAGATGATV